MAIDLAQQAGDWTMVAELVELEVSAEPKRATGWLLRILAAANMESPELSAVIGGAPCDLFGSIQEITRLAAAEMRYGHAEKGMQRIYRLRRERMGDVEAAALHLTAVLLVETALPELEFVPQVAGPGTSVVLIDDEGNRRRLTIDPEEMDGLVPSDEFVSPNDDFARRLAGLAVGATIEVLRPFQEPKTYRLDQLQSAHRSLIDASYKAVATALNPPRSVAAMSLQMEDDGTPDLTEIRRQIEKRTEFAVETMDLYKKRSATLSVVARRLGHDVIDLVRSWPTTGPKMEVGSGSIEGHAELQQLLGNEAPWVVDLTMLTELAMLGHLDVLRYLPKVFVASATRDAVGAKLESTAAYRHTGTMFAHEGQISFRETTEDDWRREREVLQAIAKAIKDHCTVLPVWGPDDIDPSLVRVSRVLSAQEYASVLLCQERGASLLTLDDRLRKIASLFGVKSVWPQELLLHMAAAGRIKALDYSLAVIKMMLWRRTFVALTVDDLTALMDQGGPWVSVGINALREYLTDPVLRFDSSVNVVVTFLGWLYARGNCEFGVVLELIEYLFEALMRHKDCPKDWAPRCTMLLFAEFVPAELGLAEERCIAEFVRRAVERTKHPMKPVTVKAKVLHIAEMPRFVSGDFQDADQVAREQVAEENRVAEPSETSATGPTEGQEQPLPAI